MGTEAHVIVTGGTDADLDLAEARIESLEARWSRFRPDSELCRLNEAAGTPTVVSRDTALLVERCFIAWTRTLGAFDPTVHDAVVANGYDRDFSQVEDRADASPRRPDRAPGLDGTIVDAARGLVWTRPGVHLDAGAIGKGLAADLVCRDLMDAGAEGACVNLGGDLRVAGSAPDGERWTISIEDPFEPECELGRVALARRCGGDEQPRAPHLASRRAAHAPHRRSAHRAPRERSRRRGHDDRPQGLVGRGLGDQCVARCGSAAGPERHQRARGARRRRCALHARSRGGPHMLGTLTWYVTRASGIVAYALLAGGTLWGLALSTKIHGRRPPRPWMLDVHRMLGALAMILTLVHVVSILVDGFVDFGVVDVLVPFAVTWKPVAVAAGIVALYLLAAVEITSLVRQRISNQTWRRVHYLSFVLFVLASVHFVAAGTDAASPLTVGVVVTAVVAVIVLTGYRIHKVIGAVHPCFAFSAR